jgi:hypothetical protein
MHRKICPLCRHVRAHPAELICEPCLDELAMRLAPFFVMGAVARSDEEDE